MPRRSLLTLTLLALVLPLHAATYTVDQSHSETTFQIRHLVTKVRGQFDQFGGKIVFDPADLANASAEFTIDAASINTFHEERDEHLRSPDFFDVEKHPEITFKSKSFEKTGKDTYDVTGDFTMHGVTKEITLPVTYLGELEDPWGNVKAGFETETTLERKEYGINWNAALDQGGFILGEKVRVMINLEVLREQDAQQ